MISLLLKRALRQRLGVKSGWGTVGVPLPLESGEEQ